MSFVKKVFAAVAIVALAYFAPVLAPQIGSWLGATGFLAKAIGAVVIAAGMSLIQLALAPSVKGTDMAASKINVRLEEPIRWAACGEVRQGGAAIFADFDSAGNLWYVVALADSILTTAKPWRYMLDDVVVNLNANGDVLHRDFRLQGKKKDVVTVDGQGDAQVTIWVRTFTEDNPVPARVAAFDAAMGSKWTADHKLVGATYAVVRMKALSAEHRHKIYKWRGPIGLGEPGISVIGMWSNVYDPRDPTQNIDNRMTWKPSTNAMLVWAWFRTHKRGRNKSMSRVAWDRVAEYATICDQNVSGLVGSTKRYQASIAVPEDKERSSAENEILLAMDAQLYTDDQGRYFARPGYYQAPTITLTRNRDIVMMESVEVQNGESETQGVIVRYTDPEANYSMQPSAPWYNPLHFDPTQAAIFLTVTIPTISNHNQAMRVAKGIGMRSQPLHKLAPTSGVRGLRLMRERFVNLNYDNIFAGDYEIATPIELDESGQTCGMGIVPVTPDNWTLLAGEEKPKPVIADLDTVPLPSTPTSVTINYRNNRLEASYTKTNREDVGYEFEYVLTAQKSEDHWTAMRVDEGDGVAYSGTVVDGTSYTVRYRSVAMSGRVTSWTELAALEVAQVIGGVTMLTATGDVGKAIIQWRCPNDISFDATTVYHNTSDDFDTSSVLDYNILGAVGEYVTYEHFTTAGDHYYWVTAYAFDGGSSTPAGSVFALVT